MPFIVIYDACVLFPAPLRDLLIRIAGTGVVRARWTETILDECFRTILEQRPDLTPERLARTRFLMNKAIPDCLVTGYEDLIASLHLPDQNDRHVLAAAIRAGAQSIVTFNLKDFPDQALSQYGIEAKHPDAFVLESLHLAPIAVCTAIRAQAETLRNPPLSSDALLGTLQQQGLPLSVAQLRKLLGTSL